MISSIHRTFASDRGSTRWWAVMASAAMILASASLPAAAADGDPPPDETVISQAAVVADPVDEVVTPETAAVEEAASDSEPAAEPVAERAAEPAPETAPETLSDVEPVVIDPVAEVAPDIGGTGDAAQAPAATTAESDQAEPATTDPSLSAKDDDAAGADAPVPYDPQTPATSDPQVLSRNAKVSEPALAVELTPLADDASVKLEGCRLPSGVVLSDPTICSDSYYTTGNLGKSWNELDLVPHRVTATDTGLFEGVIAADNKDEARPGYDYMSKPVLNTRLSTGTCSISFSDQKYATPGIGGTDVTLYRDVTLENTGAKGTVCVFDYYVRLALGSHLFPGASLHSNLANPDLGAGGMGARDVSIPVNEIEPQELDKSMTATQGRDYDWTLAKRAAPTSVEFPETCLVGEASAELPVTITVDWTRTAALPSGGILITTQVTATNPAHRIIDVSVVDKWFEGSTATGPAIHTANGSASVPAATEGERTLVPGTYTWTFSKLVESTATAFNDVATATYTDKITGMAVPGTTTATGSATVDSSGVVTDATATLSDVESIMGEGFSFSVDSVAPSQGSFGAYVLTTPTTGDVTWTTTLAPTGPGAASGSFAFGKTVYASEGTAGVGEPLTRPP